MHMCDSAIRDSANTNRFFGSHLRDFFGPESLSRVGERDVFAYVIDPPRWNWSLLRGFGHPANLTLFAVGWGLVSGCLLFALLGSAKSTQANAPSPWLFRAWSVLTVLTAFGIWARIRTLPSDVSALWLPLGVAGFFWMVSGLFLFLARRRKDETASPTVRAATTAALVTTTLVLLAALWRAWPDLPLDWLLMPFDARPFALYVAMALTMASTACLMLGLWTRVAAIVSWVLMMAFDNLNHSIANNGDVARGIVHFYLMLTPCGAVWSLDRWRQKRRGLAAATVFVHPWFARLLFLQLICIYFFNGLYKLGGETWRDGSSLYYVLAEPTLTRVSFAQFALPYWGLQAASFTVLVWELTFPLLVVFRWTRIAALWMGALFHIGIGVSMELGMFSFYMLAMYMPFLPWERLRRNGNEPPPLEREKVEDARAATRPP